MKIKTVLFLLYATSLAPFFASLSLEAYKKQGTVFSNTKKNKEPILTQVPTFEFIKPQSPETITQVPELHFDVEKSITSVSLIPPTVVFSTKGISDFFSQTFNRTEYGTDFLPHNLSHMIQFLRYAASTNQPLEFSEGVVRLFNQKIKSSSYISAPALERFLTQVTPVIEFQFAQKPYNIWQEFKSTLWTTFKKNFTFLQRHPDGFFEELSKQLERQVEANVISPERARSTLVRFCCASLDKTIWCAQDQEESWHCFKKLGSLIHTLHTKKIVPDELDVNDMYWSLIERYCFFLQLSGSQLSLKTCELMKQDLTAESIPWLRHKEQEVHTQTKTERLATAALETEARIRLNRREFGDKATPVQA